MADETPHGALVASGQWKNSRRCLVCPNGYHGPLYACESYPPELLQELSASASYAREQMAAPEWADEQRAKGIDPVSIAIMRAMFGLGDARMQSEG